MPRFKMNRWLASILTIIAFALVSTAFASQARADITRDGGRDGTIWDTTGGGAPPPPGVGDPDQPVPSSLKLYQRGSVRSGGATLSGRTAGDSRIEGNVWMLRISVMRRVLQGYWIRL